MVSGETDTANLVVRDDCAEGPSSTTNVLAVSMKIWHLVVFLAWIVGPFVLAAKITWASGWVYVTVIVLGLARHRIFVARRNPELFLVRKNLGVGTKHWDIIWNLLFWPLMAAVPIVAGFGAHRGWQSMSILAWPMGLLLFASAMAASAWAMSVNPHFEGTVRIQEDRDHRVVDTGPYGCVRHPGYVGLLLWALASPFLLRSLAALVPAGLVIGWLVLRTALEDATLRRELAGYLEYTKRVRYRLVPGLW